MNGVFELEQHSAAFERELLIPGMSHHSSTVFTSSVASPLCSTAGGGSSFGETTTSEGFTANSAVAVGIARLNSFGAGGRLLFNPQSTTESHLLRDGLVTTAAGEHRSKSNSGEHISVKMRKQQTLTGDQIDKRKKRTPKKDHKRRKTMQQTSDELQPADGTSPSASQLLIEPVKRCQKLGDKVTSLQQLVSPFGKTDTASVLHEATVYIKTLQEQIQVLSSPYFGDKSSSPWLEGEKKFDLGSRGLCLVPVESTTINLTREFFFDQCAPTPRGTNTTTTTAVTTPRL